MPGDERRLPVHVRNQLTAGIGPLVEADVIRGEKVRLRKRFVVVGALLVAVVLVWALGGLEPSARLESSPAPRGPIDAGEYSIRLGTARVRAATDDEALARQEDGKGPVVAQVIELDMMVRNQSDRDGIYLDVALDWVVDGRRRTSRERGLLALEYTRTDAPQQYGNHPRDLWAPLQATYEVPVGDAPVRTVDIVVNEIDYHEFGRAFANVIGFRPVAPVGTYRVPLANRTPA